MRQETLFLVNTSNTLFPLQGMSWQELFKASVAPHFGYPVCIQRLPRGSLQRLWFYSGRGEGGDTRRLRCWMYICENSSLSDVWEVGRTRLSLGSYSSPLPFNSFIPVLQLVSNSFLKGSLPTQVYPFAKNGCLKLVGGRGVDSLTLLSSLGFSKSFTSQTCCMQI